MIFAVWVGGVDDLRRGQCESLPKVGVCLFCFWWLRGPGTWLCALCLESCARVAMGP